MEFRERDFAGVLDFVRDLYDQRGLGSIADNNERTARIMGSLRDIVGADRVVYGEYDVERQRARLATQPVVVKEHEGAVDDALATLERGFGAHPLFRYYLQSGEARAQKVSRALTRSRFERYCRDDEFVRQLGAKFQMGVFFPAGPSLVTVVLLTRRRRDFSERECDLLGTLQPHLAQAFRNAASIARMCRGVDELVELLEGPTSSVVVLAGDGRVKRWTEQARHWIAQYCRTPFPAGEDRLPDCFAEWYGKQLSRVARIGLDTAVPRDPFIVDKQGRRLAVQLVPDHLRDEHLLLLNERAGDVSWSSLAEFGLTPRESQVLAWVAKGKTNAEVGRILQLSGRTVQKHLEHIYRKLGVETRTTATVRALKMLEASP